MNCCDDYGQCKQGHGGPARLTSYNQHFDRLGNPVYRRPRNVRVHRVIQVAGVLASLVLLAMLYAPR